MNWPIFFKLNEEHFTSHLQYKHAGTFANRKYDELSYPENQKKCDPIVVTLSKMRPHYRQSSRENATSSSNASPLASYKEKPSPPRKSLYPNLWVAHWHGKFTGEIVSRITKRA